MVDTWAAVLLLVMLEPTSELSPAAATLAPACVVDDEVEDECGPVGVILVLFCAPATGCSKDDDGDVDACGLPEAESNLLVVNDGDDLLDDAPGLLGSSCWASCADSCCCMLLLSSLVELELLGVFFFFKKLKICFAILKNFQ